VDEVVSDPQRLGVGGQGHHLVDPGGEPRWEEVRRTGHGEPVLDGRSQPMVLEQVVSHLPR